MGAKILVVEDNESIRTIVRMVLETEQYDVIEASNGKEALDCLRQHPDCALIISDLAMPVMDGYEFLDRVRNEMGLRDLPFFVLTAERDASAVLEHRATRLIRKPFSPLELLEAVRTAIASGGG